MIRDMYSRYPNRTSSLKVSPPRLRLAHAAGLVVFLACLAGGESILSGGLAASAQSGASRAEIQGLVDRIDRLQRDLTALQRQVYRGGGKAPAGSPGPAAAGNPSLMAAMQVRLDEIETEMRRFTGRMEELQHGIDTLKREFDKMASDIDFRLKRLEAGNAQQGAATPPSDAAQAGGTPSQAPPNAAVAGSAPAPLKPQVLGTVPRSDLQGTQSAPQRGAAPQAAPAPAQQAAVPQKSAPTLVGKTPEAQYKHATDLLFRSDYANAQRELAAFVKAHPKHDLAGNAQYWLGETHYARGAYRTAATVFAEGYQKYPKSPKGPDNLLKLGMSLVAIKKDDSACVTFARLLKEYPKAPASVRSSARSQRKKLNCR